MNPQDKDFAALDRPQLLSATFQASGNDNSLDALEQDRSIEELAYDPVPPRKSVSISVRYRIGGRGQPLPYPLDEGVEE